MAGQTVSVCVCVCFMTYQSCHFHTSKPAFVLVVSVCECTRLWTVCLLQPPLTQREALSPSSVLHVNELLSLKAASRLKDIITCITQALLY